jgi:hypothetical protein
MLTLATGLTVGAGPASPARPAATSASAPSGALADVQGAAATVPAATSAGAPTAPASSPATPASSSSAIPSGISSATPAGTGTATPSGTGAGTTIVAAGSSVSGSSLTGQPAGTSTSSSPAQFVAAPTSTGFVTVCGTELCLNGSIWEMYGATHGPFESDVETTITLALEEHLNTIRLTNFLYESGSLGDVYDPTLWAAVDAYIAAAGENGLHVILDLSTYRNLLWNNCDGPAYDWGSFLSWVSSRVNTVNGLVYSQDPTIALVALAGEYNAVGTYTFTANDGSACTISYTTQDLTDFFERTLAEAHADFPNQIVYTGGFLYLDWDSGIDWQTIMADPDDQICAIHVGSTGDVDTTVPNVSSYCKGMDKAWIVEEFGFPQSDGDATRASEFQSRYDLARSYGAAGVVFWNLGPEVNGVNYSSDSCDVNPQTPLTYAVVIENSP